MILKGPGATRLFETTVEKLASVLFSPKLRFTVEDPITLRPMRVLVEMTSHWQPVGLHYELDGVIDGQPVKVKYWLYTDETGYYGSISDL